jgi:hypothetical protein
MNVVDVQVLVLGGKAAPQRRAGAATALRRPSGKRGRFFDHYNDGAGTLVGIAVNCMQLTARAEGMYGD